MIYPISTTVATQSLYRLSAYISSPVDGERLEEALNKALEKFKCFKVELRGGFFRYYFDFNPLKAQVKRDNGCTLTKIDFLANRRYPFRVTYYDNKIFLDMFHGLTDGAGALRFLREILKIYLSFGGVYSDETVETSPYCDEFLRLSEGKKIERTAVKKMTGANAFAVKGKQYHSPGYGNIQFIVDSNALKLAAKAHQTGMTAYLATLAAFSMINRAKINGSFEQKEKLSLAIPVDLRRKFNSDTLANFTTIIRADIDKNTLFEEAFSKIQEQINAETEKDGLMTRIVLSSLLVKNPLIR
ncbi:MAG: hypothetical protein LBN25_04020, partial [Christensenellaceae bacterium]|nr:hypothetical protein [Christensenellaceae bacterium]